MTISVYQQGGYGTAPLFPQPIIADRDPATTDRVDPSGAPYAILQGWNNRLTDDTFIYLGAGNWVTIASVVGSLNELTGDTGTAVPTAGAIGIDGTASQITTAASGSAVTLSLPAALVAPGSFTATLGDITATDGDLVLATAGNKLNIAVGANASAGVSGALSGSPGTIVAATTAVTTSSIILISRNTPAGTIGNLSVPQADIIDGTSFVIDSDADETSTVNWLIIN